MKVSLGQHQDKLQDLCNVQFDISTHDCYGTVLLCMFVPLRHEQMSLNLIYIFHSEFMRKIVLFLWGILFNFCQNLWIMDFFYFSANIG